MKKNILFLFFLFSDALADRNLSNKQAWIEHKDPLVLSSKKGLFDQFRSVIHIDGNAIARQRDAAVHADQIVYDAKKKVIVARGDVKTFYKTGDSLFCEHAEMDTSLKRGLMRSVRSFMQDGARFTAQSVRKKDHVTHVDHASYTPCHLCKDRLNPLWSIHAKSIDYDERSGEVHYHKPQMKMWGRPLVPLPSFRFLTKRSSGILPLMSSYSQELGFYASLPTYWTMRDDQDATLTSYLMSTGGAMVSGEYRYRFASGLFDLTSAVNIPLSKDMYDRWKSDRVMSPGKRGFMHYRWHWDVNADWRFRSNVWWSGDKTFLTTRPFFGQSNASFLTSDTTLEGFLDHSFVRFRSLFYQDLIGAFKQSNVPCVFPEVTYQYTSPLLSRKHRFFIESKALSLYRHKGQSMMRLVFDGDWSFFDTAPWGQCFHISTVYRGAFYRLFHNRTSHGDQEKNQTMIFNSDVVKGPMQQSDKKVMSHQNGILFFESRWPLLNMWGTWTPVAQVIVTPKSTDFSHVPNEDSQVILFDDRNFLDKTRYLGYDRLDHCSRINYGYEWSKSTQKGHAGLFVGQSYAFFPPNRNLLPVGVRKGLSDVVARAQWSGHDYEILYRVRSNAYSLQPYFQDITWSFGPKALSFLGTYELFKEKKDQYSSAMVSHYQQLYFTASSQWGFWNGKIFFTRNTGKRSMMLDRGFSLGYKNECLDVSLIVQKSFYRQEDIVPGLTISFHFRFKNLGGFQHRSQRFAQAV